MSWGRRLQLAAVIVFIVGYAGLSHYSNSVGQARGLGVALTLLPLLSIGCWLVWRSGHRWIALLLGVAAAFLLIRFRVLLESNLTIIYLLQECGFLRPDGGQLRLVPAQGHVALCTRLRGQGPRSSDAARAALHAAGHRRMGAVLRADDGGITLGLYLFAPYLRMWSVFANFCSCRSSPSCSPANMRSAPRAAAGQAGDTLGTLRVYFARLLSA
jgi:hypothetical protein